MTPRQPPHISTFLNREPPRAIGALEILEAVDGDARGAGGELEEAGFALGGPGAEEGPEPCYDGVGGGVAAVVGEFGPVVPAHS